MSDREYEMPDLLDLDEFDEEALKKESEEVLEMRLINSGNAVFTRTAGGFLALKYKDKEYDRVGVYLTFPLTNPEEYISIREADEKKKRRWRREGITSLDSYMQKKMFKNIVNVVHEKTVLNLKNGQFLSIGENTLMGETLKLAVFNQNSINIDGND